MPAGVETLPSRGPTTAGPMNRRMKVALGAVITGVLVASWPALFGAGPSASFDIVGGLDAGRLAWALLAIYAGGLLTALTPCVFPLIPITLAVFGARAEAGRARRVALAATYTVGMAVMFSGLGFAAAAGGKLFAAQLGSPWVGGGIAIVLVALALSMFGFYEITVPAPIAARLQKVGGVGFAGAFGMGLVAGIIAAPCTGPVLSGVLVYVATTQSLPFGGGLLFVYALGVGAPFLVLAAFSMKLPKSGPWMDAVKSVLGLVLAALAVGYLRDAFPSLRAALYLAAESRFAAAMGVAIASVGVLLGAVDRSFHGSSAERLLKGAGAVVFVAGFTYRTAAANVAAAADWRTDVDAALAEAATRKIPVLVDFFAEWCEACKELDRLVYPDPRVQQETQRFVRLKVDGTNENEAIDALYEKFRVLALPTVAFVDSQGTILDKPRVTGFLEPAEFVDVLRQVR